MAQPLHTIKPSFSGGEFAPSLYSRVDIQKYSSGARKLKNFIVHPHGGISNRPGTKFIAKAKYDNKTVTLIPFEYSTLQTYILEFGEYYIRFYTNGGRLEVSQATSWSTSTGYTAGNFVQDPSSSTTFYYCLQNNTSSTLTFAQDRAASTGNWVMQSIFEVPTPYAEGDLAQLNYTQSADVLFITHPDFVPKQLNRYSTTTWTLTDYEFINGPFQIANDDLTHSMRVMSTSGNTTLVSSAAFFQATHEGAQMELFHEIEGQSLTQAFTVSTSPVYSNALVCGGTWRIITHGTWTGTFRVEKQTQDATGATSTWVNIRQFTGANDFNVDTYGNEDMSNDALPINVRVQMVTCSSGTCNVDLSTDEFQTHGVFVIQDYLNSTAVSGTMQRPTGSTINTTNWAEGSWSDYRGWPAVVEFSPQDRLIFASTYNEPQTQWMTKTSNYYDFGRSYPLVDSDGITVNLPSRQVNAINAIAPLTEIILLTLSSEWSVTGSNGVITPSTVTQKIHGYAGSYGVRPVIIGNRALFIQAIGSVIRDLGYELTSDSFTGNDLSILSNHLFTNMYINDMTYQQSPDRLVWCVRSDGIFLSLTYMREQEVAAWTWHETLQSGTLPWVANHAYVTGNWVINDALTYSCLQAHTSSTSFTADFAVPYWTQESNVAVVESVSCIQAVGYSDLWLSVKRGTQRYIENMARRMASEEPADQYFVDCGITYHEPLNVTAITLGTPVTITSASHGLQNNDVVQLNGITAYPSLNGTTWVIGNVATDTFQLITQKFNA